MERNKMKQFFTQEKVHPNIIKIMDLTGVYSYLVEGEHTAALLDTGTGVGSIKDYVSSITTLPVIVICTHGHVDHIGGAYGFDKVYLNEKDFALAKEHSRIVVRKEYTDMMIREDEIAERDYVPAREKPFLPMQEGQLFDLGGITLEAIQLPGHTMGMTCILIKEMRILLLGDACNSSTFLFMPECTSVEEYKNNLEKFLPHKNRFDLLWFSHGPYEGSSDILNEGIDLCKRIMKGEHDNIPFDFMNEKAIMAKTIDKDRSRVDGKVFNIIFNPQRIYKK